MSNASAKKLSLALYLNPATSQADRYAVGALQQWYSTAKRSHDNRHDLEMVVRLFHRDIYLAGLYLHLLSPRLCQGVAGALDHHNVNLVTLQQLCSASGLTWESSGPRQDGFSPTQVAQLQQLLQTQASEEPAAVPADGPALEQLLSQQADLLAEVQALRTLVQQQAQALSRLPAGQPAVLRAVPANANGVQSESNVLSELVPDPDELRQIRKKGLF